MDRARAQELAMIFVEGIAHPLKPHHKNILRIIRRDYFMYGKEELFCLSESLACSEYLSTEDLSLIAKRVDQFSPEALQDISFVLKGQDPLLSLFQ